LLCLELPVMLWVGNLGSAVGIDLWRKALIPPPPPKHLDRCLTSLGPFKEPVPSQYLSTLTLRHRRSLFCWVAFNENLGMLPRQKLVTLEWQRPPSVSRCCFYRPSTWTFWLLFIRLCCMNVNDPEDGGDMFLRNVGWLSTHYTSYPRRAYSSLRRCVVHFKTPLFV
jgi:hypothetical protein